MLHKDLGFWFLFKYGKIAWTILFVYLVTASWISELHLLYLDGVIS